jgi:hypothetical protein
MTSLLRILIVTTVLAGFLVTGYWLLTSDQRQKAIVELTELKRKLEGELAQRQAMIERLSRSRRIAHLKVLDQDIDQECHTIRSTSLLFIELNDNGAEIGRQTIRVPGDVIFVDAWTVKFDAESVAAGDPFQGKTLVLLRRVYSDVLPPAKGIPLDTPGAIPPGYAASDVGRFEKQLWANFWEIATDWQRARAMGVRVAQGEAVYKPMRTGQTFELVVDAVGGMSLTPMPATSDETALSHAEKS